VQAWEEDPLDTLKLTAHLRDVRDGKADRDLFHDCIAWLWEFHPLTLLANLEEVVKVAQLLISAKEVSTHHAMPFLHALHALHYLKNLCNYTAWHAAGLCDALN